MATNTERKLVGLTQPYMPNQGQAAPFLGVIWPGTIANDYLAQVMAGLHSQADALGYGMIVAALDAKPKPDLQALFEQQRLAGVVLIVPDNIKELSALCRKHLAQVILVDYENDQDIRHVSTISINNQQSMFQSVQYLLALNHRRIGFITGKAHLASSQARLEGYQKALRYADIKLDEALIVEGDWSEEAGYQAAKQFLNLPRRPSAIQASNDLMALGALRAVQEAGLIVPTDLSIVGFDDVALADQANPALTTTRQPMQAIGAAAMTMLHQATESGSSQVQRLVLNTQLIIRASTGPALR